MANIAISELETSATTLKNDDYILVSSKNDNGSFTSAKMLGSALKSQVGGCQFTEDKVKNACIAALTNKNISTLTSSQVSSVIDGKNLSTLTSDQVSSVIDGKNLSTLTSDQVGSVIDGKNLSTLTSDEVSSTIDSKNLSTLTNENVTTDVNISLANESIVDSIYQLRINQLQMKDVYDQYLSNLTILVTKIGDKVFSGTYGNNKTLTLEISGAEITEQPTILPESKDGIYPEGTRVTITAPFSNNDSKFLGWYHGDNLLSNQQSYSYEVTHSTTLTAKYQTCKTIREWISDGYQVLWTINNYLGKYIILEFTGSAVSKISSNDLENDGHGVGKFTISTKSIRTPQSSGYKNDKGYWVTEVAYNSYPSLDAAKDAIMNKKIFINC